jgi:hypothetical protein
MFSTTAWREQSHAVSYRRVSLFWHLNDLVLYTLVVPE